jgi:hypothetical protein
MTAEFIFPDDARWKKLLTRTNHDFYHLPEYITLAASHEGGQACAFLAEEGDKALLIPLLMRPLPEKLDPKNDFCDVLTPYGYPGPILAGNPGEETVASFLEHFFWAGKERGVISAFWRLHPLLPFPIDTLNRFGLVVLHGRTVYVDLSRSPERLWKETSNNHKRGIKHLLKNGFVAVRNDWGYWPSFLELYRDAMNRLEASDFYFFPNTYFEGLKRTLGDRIDLWTILSPQKEVAATALCISENGIVEYHLGATAREFFEWSPLKLVIYEAILHAREIGCRVMHLGGGLGGTTDSLFSFKSRFSPLSSEFHTFRYILLKNVYDDMTERQFAVEGVSENDDFFPAYRTPA